MYDVAFEDKRVKKQFDGLQKSEQEEIKEALDILKSNISISEKLVGDLSGHWSLHIGKSLRAIYKIDGNTIVIRAVGHHHIYQEFSRYLRKSGK